MQFLFRTQTCMKPYNGKRWYIDSNILPDTRITADSLPDALERFREYAEHSAITISKNGIRNREPMFRDSKDGSSRQVGYVITGKTSFQKDDGSFVEQYIDLWVEILTIVKTVFPEEERGCVFTEDDLKDLAQFA